MPFTPPTVDVGGGFLTPIHWSARNGVHADFHRPGLPMEHIPYQGQTTLDMFGSGVTRSLPEQLGYINTYNLGSLRG
ncbi:MAG: hypothetical protein HY369_03595 [Candidatus Aenigmarchaeota archaeon]|nr:hypothetical protein [Candidatus Aenigmarchaeota archaeon]